MKVLFCALKLKLLFALLVIFSIVTPASSTEFRDLLSVPTVDVYRATLKYHKANDLEKVKKSIFFLKTLVENLDKKYETQFFENIIDSIAEDNGIMCGILLTRLIYYDIRDLLDLGMQDLENSGGKAKKRFKSAYLEFLLIKHHVEEINFSVATKVTRAFRNMSLLIDKQDTTYTYSREKSEGISVAQIAQLVKGVEHELGKIFQ